MKVMTQQEWEALRDVLRQELEDMHNDGIFDDAEYQEQLDGMCKGYDDYIEALNG